MALTHKHEIKYRIRLVFITENLDFITVYPISEHSDRGYYDYLEKQSGLSWFKDYVLEDDVENGTMSTLLNSLDYLFDGNGMIKERAIAVKVYYEKIERVTAFWETAGKEQTRVEREIILDTQPLKVITKPRDGVFCRPLSHQCLHRLSLDAPESFEKAATLKECYDLKNKGEIK